jgi:hypothetical protein
MALGFGGSGPMDKEHFIIYGMLLAAPVFAFSLFNLRIGAVLQWIYIAAIFGLYVFLWWPHFSLAFIPRANWFLVGSGVLLQAAVHIEA